MYRKDVEGIIVNIFQRHVRIRHGITKSRGGRMHTSICFSRYIFPSQGIICLSCHWSESCVTRMPAWRMLLLFDDQMRCLRRTDGDIWD